MLPIKGDLDFKNNAGIINLGQATANGQPVVFEQLQSIYTYLNTLNLNNFTETLTLINPTGITAGIGYSEITPSFTGTLNLIHVTLTPASSNIISFSLKKNGNSIENIQILSNNRELFLNVNHLYLSTDYIGVDVNSTVGDVKSAIIKLFFTKT